MRLLTLILLLGFLSSCFEKQGSAKISTGGSGPIAPGTPIRWSAAGLAAALDLKTSESFTNEFVAADLDGNGLHPIDQMSKLWNDSHDYTFLKVPSDAVANLAYADVSSFRDGQMGIYKSFTWFPNVSSSALAITQFFGFRRNVGTASEYVELQHADIIVNYRDYNFSTDTTDNNAYDLHSVILHEQGHLIGLPHNWDWAQPSIMQPFLGITEDKRLVTAADVTSVANLYFVGAPLEDAGGGGFASYSPNPDEGAEVSGTFELRADGSCHHYINKEKILVH
jgi:hypothetical protein